MKSQLENFNKLQRETFDSCAAKSYNRVVQDIVERLDGFCEAEALALLDSAKSLLNLRRVWRLTGNELVKQYRSEQVFR
jgi:hypothetical protein